MTVHHLFDYAYSCLHPSNKLLINAHVQLMYTCTHNYYMFLTLLSITCIYMTLQYMFLTLLSIHTCTFAMMGATLQ